MTTAIEWTDTTWNPTTGCDRVSPGCDHCYALTMAKRLKGMGSAKYQRDGDPRTSGPGFGITEHHGSALEAPLSWRKPRRVFVNSMSDLFHDGVSDGFIGSVFEVMAKTPQHTYQVLTKRHGRMRSLLNRWAAEGAKHDWAGPGTAVFRRDDMAWVGPIRWPLPHVWLGVSVEDQKRAELRVPALLDTPAAVRFLSCEPLLGAVDLGTATCPTCSGHRWVDDQNWSPEHPELWRGERYPEEGRIPCAACSEGDWSNDDAPHLGVDWVIVGGESGPGARPMHPDWARQLRDQCSGAAVPFFFKQWGDYGPSGDLVATKGTGWASVEEVTRLGKKAAGRELDGRTWDEFPQRSS